MCNIKGKSFERRDLKMMGWRVLEKPRRRMRLMKLIAVTEI